VFALKCLNVASIPPVVELAIVKCQGNPLLVREMLFRMLNNNKDITLSTLKHHKQDIDPASFVSQAN